MTSPALTARLTDRWAEVARDAPGTVSIALHAGGLPLASRLPHATHYAASTMKLAVLGAALRRLDADPELRGERLEMRSRFPGHSGASFRLAEADDQDPLSWGQLGELVRVDELLERMIVLSSNIATGVVLDHIGLAAVADFLQETGLDAQVRVDRAIGDSGAERAGRTNTITAEGLARLIEVLLDGSVLSASSTVFAWQALVGQRHRGMILAGLPAHTLTASKSGWVDGVRHDVAVVVPVEAPRFVLSVCTTTGLDDENAETLVAAASAATWEEWVRWHE